VRGLLLQPVKLGFGIESDRLEEVRIEDLVQEHLDEVGLENLPVHQDTERRIDREGEVEARVRIARLAGDGEVAARRALDEVERVEVEVPAVGEDGGDERLAVHHDDWSCAGVQANFAVVYLGAVVNLDCLDRLHLAGEQVALAELAHGRHHIEQHRRQEEIPLARFRRQFERWAFEFLEEAVESAEIFQARLE